MGVYIRNFTKPATCEACPFHYVFNNPDTWEGLGVCRITGRPDGVGDCPLIEVDDEELDARIIAEYRENTAREIVGQIMAGIERANKRPPLLFIEDEPEGGADHGRKG